MTNASHNRRGGPGKKEKQEKSSVQSSKDQQKQEEIEDHAYHGGRDKWPDSDVNPATIIHVDDDEEGEPAATDDHDARRHKDRETPVKQRTKPK